MAVLLTPVANSTALVEISCFDCDAAVVVSAAVDSQTVAAVALRHDAECKLCTFCGLHPAEAGVSGNWCTRCNDLMDRASW